MKRSYRPELDGVRFFAFLLVFTHHVLPRGDLGTAHQFPLSYRIFGDRGWPFVTAFSNSCGAGLCLFFVLSAYLITRLLLEERTAYGDISVRKFYVRRILRIWPLYYWGVLLGFVWIGLTHTPQDIPRLLAYLFFVGNIYCSSHGWSWNPLTPLWSIAIEEQFYLLWPWAMRRLSRASLAICALLAILAANAALIILGVRGADADYTIWTNSFVQFQMFATGVLLALLPNPRAGRVFTGIGMTAISFGMWFAACFFCHAKQPASATVHVSVAGLVAGYALFALGSALFLQGMCVIGADRLPQSIAWLGRRSYGLYVYHLQMVVIARTLLPSLLGPISSALALALTILTAAASYKYLELPFLHAKKRFERVSGLIPLATSGERPKETHLVT